MLSIISIGVSYPDTVLTNTDIEHYCSYPKIREDFPVESRRVSLPIKYIKLTGNSDIRLSELVAKKTTTDLGVEAVLEAVKKANIDLNDIGVAIADTATTLQTTPAESQRIIGRLGLKIPCYDVIGVDSAFPLHMETFANWKKDRLPKYLVSIITNTPSLFVSYGKDSSAQLYVGDCAVATIFSREEKGIFNMDLVSYKSSPVNSTLLSTNTSKDILSIPSLAPLKIHAEAFSQIQSAKLEKNLQELVSKKQKLSKIISSHLVVKEAEAMVSKLYSSASYLSNVPTFGYSFGSTAPAILAQYSTEITAGEKVAVLTGGADACIGAVILTKQ